MLRFTVRALYESVRVKKVDVLVRFTGQTTGEHSFRQIVAGLSQRTGFDLRLIYARFVADKTALGLVLF